MRRIVCLDFDGVLHSYNSGWQGARVVSDAPVPGALDWLCSAMYRFDVAVLSSRSHQFGGRRAMKRWLTRHLTEWFKSGDVDNTTMHWKALGYCEETAPWDNECRYAAQFIVGLIQWPKHKPPAHYTIDDRGHQFTGEWPSLDSISSFRPWNREAPPRSE